MNYKRVIETWFDEPYKEYSYTREPLAKFADISDISGQLKFKEQLKCKSFDSYMENIAYDVFEKFTSDIRSYTPYSLECLDMIRSCEIVWTRTKTVYESTFR